MHHVEVVFEQIDWAFSSRISSGLVRTRFDQQCRAFPAAKKDSAVERGVFAFIAIALVGVGPCRQEFGDRLGMSGVACPAQRGLPQEWVLGVDIRLLGEEAVDFSRSPKAAAAHSCRMLWGPLLSTAIGDDDGCPSERDDGEHAHDQGQQDAFHTVNQKATQATPLPKHGGKEPLSRKNSGMRKPWMMLLIAMNGGQRHPPWARWGCRCRPKQHAARCPAAWPRPAGRQDRGGVRSFRKPTLLGCTPVRFLWWTGRPTAGPRGRIPFGFPTPSAGRSIHPPGLKPCN